MRGVEYWEESNRAEMREEGEKMGSMYLEDFEVCTAQGPEDAIHRIHDLVACARFAIETM